MKLILSDKPINIEIKKDDIKFIDLSSLKITNCIGCLDCWTKTPGKCIIRDDAVRIYPDIAKSNTLLYISRIKYGGYDTVMKTMLERAIPIQQAFIQIISGETHHIQRNVAPKHATIIAYGDICEEEKKIFKKLISRNSLNMMFENYNIIFTKELHLEKIVNDVVAKWEA